VSLPGDVLNSMYYLNDLLESDTSASDDEGRIECLLCLNISRTDQNRFPKGTNALDDEKDLVRSVIIELRNLDDFSKIFDKLANKIDFIELTREESKCYSRILEQDTTKEKSQIPISIYSPKIEGNNPFLKGKKDSDTLLIYPFNGSKDDIEKCADALTKAGYFTADTTKDCSALTTNIQDSKANSSRNNSFEIRVVDYASLEPGEWLNDTMIDFWLQWYVIFISRSLILIRYSRLMYLNALLLG
jgi:hypothetical protein